MKFTKAAVKITYPDSGVVCWFSGFLDNSCSLPTFSSSPVLFSLRYCTLVSSQLRKWYPMVTVVIVRD